MLVLRIAYRVKSEAYLVFHGSLVNIVNMDKIDYSLNPRLRHSRTRLEFGILLPEAKKQCLYNSSYLHI